jgi:hypothetical protein
LDLKGSEQTPLSRLGVETGLSDLSNLNEQFSLQGLEDALAAYGYTVQEQLSNLIEMARGAPAPSDRMRAMKEIRALIREVIEANQTQMTLTRKRESTDEFGNKVTEVATFAQRFRQQGAPSEAIKHDRGRLSETDADFDEE